MKDQKYIIFLLLVIAVKIHSQYITYSPASFLNQQFEKYNIICLDEGPHGTLQSHAFIRTLLSNDSVSSKLNYLIVEFANIIYQDILDKYIYGEEVPDIELQKIWRNSTQAHSPLYEMPVYKKLLETIRDINRISGNKIRVLAGDPEIDWKEIQTTNDFFKSITQRDVFPSELAIKYGIKKNSKVLLIYGGEHITKNSDNSKDSTFWTIPYYINHKYPKSVFTIGILNSKSINSNIFVNSILINNDTARYDAYYYVGNSDNFVTDTPQKIDIGYWNELNRRSEIVWGEGIEEELKLIK